MRGEVLGPHHAPALQAQRDGHKAVHSVHAGATAGSQPLEGVSGGREVGGVGIQLVLGEHHFGELDRVLVVVVEQRR